MITCYLKASLNNQAKNNLKRGQQALHLCFNLLRDVNSLLALNDLTFPDLCLPPYSIGSMILANRLLSPWMF